MRLVTAENLTHSNWTVNISEGDLPSPPRVARRPAGDRCGG